MRTASIRSKRRRTRLVLLPPESPIWRSGTSEIATVVAVGYRLALLPARKALTARSRTIVAIDFEILVVIKAATTAFPRKCIQFALQHVDLSHDTAFRHEQGLSHGNAARYPAAMLASRRRRHGAVP